MSDVLIKGAKIPKDCFECPLYNFDHVCVILERQNLAFDKPPDCPLVEVVRCKDCIFWAKGVTFQNYCTKHDLVSYPDDYCAWGEE